MKIRIIKQFGNLRVGEIHNRDKQTSEKLIKLGYAISDSEKTDVDAIEKELKIEQTKEFKTAKKTK